jgi:hypothetical protein
MIIYKGLYKFRAFDSLVREYLKPRCFIEEFFLSIIHARQAQKEFIKENSRKVRVVSVELAWCPFLPIINGWTSSSKSNFTIKVRH